MTFTENSLVKLIGKKSKTQEEIGFIDLQFHKFYNKKKNQLKRINKRAKASIYGWTRV